jgi:hypothetical protein
MELQPCGDLQGIAVSSISCIVHFGERDKGLVKLWDGSEDQDRRIKFPI